MATEAFTVRAKAGGVPLLASAVSALNRSRNYCLIWLLHFTAQDYGGQFLAY